jgi:hypothetical protein
MKWLKKVVCALGIMMVATQSQAQIVNGDFEAGATSWSWAQSPLNGGGCNTVKTFTPTVGGFNSDVPFKFNNYGRSAKADGGQNTFANSAFFCRQISQTVFIPVGSNLQYEIWTNARRSPTFSNNYSAATVIVTLQDTASSLIDNYTVTPAICDTCNTPLFQSLPIGSKFWGKTVKITFTTTNEYRMGTASGGYLYSANVYIDNVTLVKSRIADVKPRTGAWYNSNRSGHGFHISKAPNNQYQLMWYTYLPNGKPIWYISDVAGVNNGVLTSKIYKSTWNAVTQTNSLAAIGDIKLEMNFSDTFTLYWDLYSINGDSPTEYEGGETMRHLLPGEGYTGLWYEPAYSGYGYSVDQRLNGLYSAVTAFYYENGEPVWARGEKTVAPTAGSSFSMTAYTGIGLCPECNGQRITLTPSAAGEIGLSLDTNNSWILMQNASGATVWQRGSPQQPVNTLRLTVP